METLAKVIGGMVLVAAALVIGATVFAFPVKWLWNWLMPNLFHLPTITVFQAAGLNWLCSFLFKPSVATSGKK